MIYISQLIGQKVWDAYGHELGHLQDLLVTASHKALPPVAALVLQGTHHKLKYIASSQIATLWPSITLKVDAAKLSLYQPKSQDLHLKDRVLDQQIVDLEGRRLVRVNDLQIARKADLFMLTGVDVSALGMFRRLGVEKIAKTIAKILKRPAKSRVIPWEFVASIEHDDPLRLKVSQDRIVRMPPADIASILDDLDHHTTKALLQGFTNEDLADTLEESSIETQVAFLSQMEPERAADILEEMDPDEAADLLSDLPDQTSQNLLELMEDEEADEVRGLLDYPEESAGGIMTTEFAQIPDNITVGEALEYLRQSKDALEDEVMYYVYILDKQQTLVGMISLRDLVISPLDQKLDAWKSEKPITVDPHSPQDEVAYIIAKYDLLSVPVVELETGKMLGIVTVDDALDTVLPTAWKKKLPRFF